MRPFEPFSGVKPWLRRVRGWFYRRSCGSSRGTHRRRRSGFERKSGAEEAGHTLEAWVHFLVRHGLAAPPAAVVVELAAGDGLVGSLGAWLEKENAGIRCFLWEHRSIPLGEARRNRSAARVMEGRLLDWSLAELPSAPWLVTSFCGRQTSCLWRAIGQAALRPAWVVVWNPSGRPVWWRRARQSGYRLQWVHHNREYYRSL